MKNIILVLLHLVLIGCTTTDPIGLGSVKKNYIQSYFIADDVESLAFYAASDRRFILEFSGSPIFKKDTEQFQALANKYGDLSYNRRLVYQPGKSDVLANELIDISVVSDTDYDDLHLSGTALDDIISYSGTSLYAFVKSGYNYQVDKSFEKTLADISPDDMKLLTIYFNSYVKGQLTGHFRFVTAPTLSKKHNITMTITDADGNVFSIKKLIDFDDASMRQQAN